MLPEFSIIYAHRNREVQRVKTSLESLKQQTIQNFEVIFVDYGSEENLEKDLKKLTEDFLFVRYFHLPVPQMLWNKSKALNHGINKAVGEFVFIADIDLYFHPETTAVWQKLKHPYKFYLFSLGYLNKQQTRRLFGKPDFQLLKASRFGKVNGMVLTSKESLLRVNGLDEFFHFYGAEDEDLFARLEKAGYDKEERKEELFLHMWHQSFSGSKEKNLNRNPRIKDIMRINSRHFQHNLEREIIRPFRQQEMGSFLDPDKAKALKDPDITLEIPNSLSIVEHFLREELPSLKGNVIKVKFFEDSYFRSIKYKFKIILGKTTIPYISMKEVNDMVLKEILYNYRDHSYSFSIQDNLKNIVFTIQL